MSGIAANLVFHGDGTVTFGGVTRPLAEISEIRVTGTGGDDTFVIDFGGTDPGITIGFDGAAGFDTLETRGSAGFSSRPSDGTSGAMQFGSTRVESVLDSIAAADLAVDDELRQAFADDLRARGVGL